VIFQGLLGGLRVIGNDVQLAKIHGIFGPTFFGLCVAMAVVTSRLWRDAPQNPATAEGGKLQRLAIITACLALLQIAVGAHLRHLPVDFTPAMFRGVVFFHLILAAALVVHIVLLAVRVLRKHRSEAKLVRPALALVALIVLQVALGSATWVINYAWPTWMHGFEFASTTTLQAGGFWQAIVVTGHQAMGSLILAFTVVLALRSVRLLPAKARPASPSVKLTGVLA
jgi:cytochrome c oxidase assembly protein subunit 15